MHNIKISSIIPSMQNIYKSDIKNIKDATTKTIQDLDIKNKRVEIRELEKDSLNKDFWCDSNKAKEVMSRLEYLKKEVSTAEKILKSCEELEEIFDMANDDEKKDLIEDYLKIERELKKFEKQKFLSGKYDVSNTILSIHAGQGGTEAQDWAEMLLRMYTRYCERQNWKVDILNTIQGNEAGISSVTMEITGSFSYGYLKKEMGTHRLVRLSPFNAQNLRQTSFAGVEVLPIIKDDDEIEIPESDIDFKAVRSGGPGGQSVNKTSSAVVLTHIPTNITVNCSKERDQFKNRQTAMKILKSKLLLIQMEEREKKIKDLKGEYKIAGWGNQIRNYILHPYKLVKDLRTGVESTNPEDVLDGNLDELLEAQLRI